jgi:signal transduction histidine kinase
MLEEKIIFVLIIGLIIFSILLGGIVLFILQFRKHKILHMEELLKTKLEIQDETLTYIGRELHDNLGQLLTVTKIHSNRLVKTYPEDTKMAALDSVIEKTISELRGLSRSLNNSRINDFGLVKEIANEVERIEKMQVAEIDWQTSGEQIALNTDKSIILYRVIQEFLNNSLKYSAAKKIKIHLHYLPHELHIELSDNGSGFEIQHAKSGSGITNIKNRVHLLHANSFSFQSAPGQGTQLSLTLPII